MASTESVVGHAWAPEEDAFLSDGGAFGCAGGRDAQRGGGGAGFSTTSSEQSSSRRVCRRSGNHECVASKAKQTRMRLHVLCWLGENKSENHMHTQKEQVTSAVQPEYRNPIISDFFYQMDSFQTRGARPLSPIHMEGPLAAPLSSYLLSCSQESQMSPCAGPTSFAVGRCSPRMCARPHPTWLERNSEIKHTCRQHTH